MKIGLTNPTPANASAPREETHIASMTLYKLVMNREIINGIDNLTKALLGSPSIESTPSKLVLDSNSIISPILFKKITYKS